MLPEEIRAVAHDAEPWPGLTPEVWFRTLVENVHEYALFLMDKAGTVLCVNPGVRRILGWGETEIVGRSISVIFPPEDIAAGVPGQEMKDAARHGRAPDDRWLICRDGTRFYASGVVEPIRDSGTLRGFVKVLRDITDDRRLEAERAAMADEHRRVAETLQRSLLLAPPPDTFPGITVKTLYEPAWDDALIGGDVFDVFALRGDRVACVVGDVTGKGLGAATYTAEVKFVLRGYLREHPSPGIALERLNNFVVEAEQLDWTHLGSTYLALACVVVDTRTGDLVCAAAGMEPPFVLRARTDEVVGLSGLGPLLGVEAHLTYDDQWERLSEGDVLALFTDGLTEARRGHGGDFFGYEGVVQALREERNAQKSLADLGEAIAARARTFAGGRLQDDVCLLLVRRTGYQRGTQTGEKIRRG